MPKTTESKLVGVSASVGGLMHHPLLKGRNYEFDKTRDLHKVEPASVLLLSEVLASGVVPPDTQNLDFNDIDDPNKVAGRVQNVFDAIDLGKQIASSASAMKPAAEAPATTPSAPAITGAVSPDSGEK